MKKQLIYLSLLFFSFFGFINVTYAASLSNQSGTNNLTPGATSCSGFPCYNSSFDGYANIGIRFTLINRETGAIKNGKHIDILTSGLANDLNTSPKSILSVPNNVNKIELVYSSGSKYGNYSNYLKYESMGIDANPDVITHLYNDSSVQKRLQSHMNNFNSIEVKSSSTSGNQFYAKILGDNKLITNYNNKNDDAGDIFNDISDKKFFDIILAALWTGNEEIDDATVEANIGTYINDIVSGGYVVQIEPTTVINFKSSSSRRYYIYGTTADIRAISSYMLYQDNGISGYPNIENGYSIYNLYNEGAQDAVRALNVGIYGTMSIAGYSTGSSSYCNDGVDWNKSDYYACGIGIIDISELTDLPVCQVVEDPSGDGYLYYGQGSKLLNDLPYPPEQSFINDCVCDVSGKTDSQKNRDEQKYNDYASYLDEEYYKTWCYVGDVEPKSDVCKIEYEDQYCDKDSDETTYTFTVGNKNITACVLDSIDVSKSTDSGSKGIRYQQGYNDYCQIACAENFKFTMPTKKFATAGTYFEYFNNSTETIEINSNRICSSRVDYNKFYNDMFDNNGNESEKSGLSMDFDNRSITYSSVKQAVDSKSGYVGGLNQQVKDYDQLVKYFQYLNNSSNYSSSDTSSCKTWNHDLAGNATTCNTYYQKYSASIGGKTETCYEESGESKTTCAENFDDRVKKAKEELEDAKEYRSKIIQDVNTCTTSVRNDKLNDKATMKYNYDEQYEINNFVEDESLSVSNENTLYCNDLTYSDDINNFSCNGTAPSDKQTINNIYDCSTDDCKIYKINYTAKIRSSIKKYKSNTLFYTQPASGLILKTPTALATNIGYVFPVKLTTKGVLTGTPPLDYQYHFNIDDLGEYLPKPINYYCYYGVKNDVTNPTKPNFFYRNISLNAFNPNNRDLGKNWSNEKGEATQCEIDGGRYDTENKKCIEKQREPEAVYETPEYSFTLTPENMKEIRDYNRKLEESGNGYGDFNMTKINDILDKDGNKLEEGQWYTSDFLRKSSVCPNCFTTNTLKDPSDLFQKWKDNDGKLSGLGPAWK